MYQILQLISINFPFCLLTYLRSWYFINRVLTKLINTVFPHIVSSWGNYSSFHYIRENLIRKLYEIFKLLWIQKRIVAAAIMYMRKYGIFLNFKELPNIQMDTRNLFIDVYPDCWWGSDWNWKSESLLLRFWKWHLVLYSSSRWHKFLLSQNLMLRIL